MRMNILFIMDIRKRKNIKQGDADEILSFEKFYDILTSRVLKKDFLINMLVCMNYLSFIPLVNPHYLYYTVHYILFPSKHMIMKFHITCFFNKVL